MERQLIAKINGSDIYAVSTDKGIFVPVKPICTTLGISFKKQHEKILEDDILSSVVTLRVTTGADDKQYEMVCLPLQYIFGWLFTINPKNVKPEAKESVIHYRRECYDVLYAHFYGSISRVRETNEKEISLLEDLRKALEHKKELSMQIKAIEKEIDTIRATRLNPVPSLFD